MTPGSAGVLLTRLFVLTLLASFVAAPEVSRGAEKPPVGKKYALLIGCTTYQNNDRLTELWGPANDVPKMADLLHEQFAFPKADIKQLVGWPDDPKKRASYANIVAAFKELIEKAKPDDQIVILLSGHGTRIPIAQPQKEQNWKANHLAFLPLDVKAWQDNRLENAVLDDQLSDWLKQLRDKKARVLVLFDCCHAGSMTRGGQERQRTVKPQDLGIPDEAIKTAVQRAQEGFKKEPGSAERTRGGPALLPGGLNLPPGEKDKGSVTAVYACQPYEEAPELPRPGDAAQVKENYFGLLSATLISILKNQGQTLTYRELGQALASAYRDERGGRGPTPFLEGDLDRQVLGQERWPGRSAVVLEKADGKLRVTAGALMGLTQGSILAVHPPAGTGKPDAVLGYLRVTQVFPGLADVSPCDHGKTAAVTPDKLPDRSVCRLVERQLIEGLKLAVAKPTEEEKKKEPEKAAARLKELAPALAALEALAQDEDFKDLIRLTAEENAEWLLGVEEGKVVLWQNTGARLDAAAEKERDQEMQRLGQPVPRRLFGGYPNADAQAVKEGLQGDLQKIFTWRNVWRIAAAANRGGPAGDQKVKLQIHRLENEMPAGQLLSGSAVPSGQRTQLEVHNEGLQAVWLTLLLLDNDFGIKVVTTTLEAGKTLRNKATLRSKTFGPEGVVVLAVPLQGNSEPQYRFLEQAPLRTVVGKTRGERFKAADLAPKTPFGTLAKSALLGKGTRSFDMDVDTSPVVLSWSWTVLP